VRSPSSSEPRARVREGLRGRLRADVRAFRPWLVAAAALSAVLASGCGHVGVKAHQRELLADRIMRFDADPQERAADEHVLANREGAIGGTGTSGGGCGCN